jgi:NAD(P)-dependent dehydrogenase (short-subunit alcohol dehydrogenase family)
VVERTALVTGASGGIGAAIAHAMLDRGYRVISLALENPDWTHPGLESRVVDLFDARATEAVAREIGRDREVSHIVHNAGVIRPNAVDAASAGDIAALAQLHLGAALSLLQAALPAMKQTRFGRIVLIASRAALGAEGRTAYSATKAGIIGMGRTWALELAPFGITVNMVAPGPIQGTHMFHEIVPAGSAREAALANAIPMKRLGRPEDVANAVLFFADDASSFVTGQVLYVCGGASVGTLVI